MICQVLADVLNRPVEAVENPRLAGATGAAALMAVGFGILPDIKAIKTMIRVRAVYQPPKKRGGLQPNFPGIQGPLQEQ